MTGAEAALADDPRPGSTRRRARPRRRWLLAPLFLLVAGVLAAVVLATRHSGPSNSAAPLDRARLRPGTCASVGAALAETHQRIGDLRARVSTARDVAGPLSVAQTALERVAGDPAVGPQLQALVAQIGLVRIGSRLGTYDVAAADDAFAAQGAVEKVCLLP